MKAFIYLRISQDRAGEAVNVGSQLRECEALAASRGYEVVATFEDNDTSAYSGRRREGYEAMMARLSEVSVVIAWHADRLHRQPAELESFVSAVLAADVRIETVKGGPLDLSSHEGLLQARFHGMLAAYESGHKSDRVRMKRRTLALAGEWAGGPRPYGWDVVNGELLVNEGEASIVREAHRRIVGGESLGAVVRWANEEGARTPSGPRREGQPWATQAFRRMLLRPRNAGISVYSEAVKRGQPRPKPVEVGTLKAEPLVSRSMHEAVVAILSDPGRRTAPGNLTEHLGSGLYRCVCGAPMYTGKRSYKGESWRVYRCVERGSGHVTKKLEETDALVRSVAVALLGLRADASASADDEAEALELEAQLKVLEARRAEAADAYAAGVLSLSAFVQADERLSGAHAEVLERMGSLRSRGGSSLAGVRLGKVTSSPGYMVATVEGGDFEAAAREWDAMTLADRRMYVRRWLNVTLHPVSRSAPRKFDPSSVRIDTTVPGVSFLTEEQRSA